MTEEFTVEQEEAMALLDSLRGQYIIAQALHYGIQELEKVPVPYQETDNLNDMKLLADECGVIWEDAIAGFVRDGRIGHSHLNVPGHDGKYGFGGSCFPKDIQAIINFSEELNVDMSVLKGAWKTNLKVRPERDWEQLKGRAVIDE